MFSNIQSLLQPNLTELDIFITVWEKVSSYDICGVCSGHKRDVQSAAGGKKLFGLGFC